MNTELLFQLYAIHSPSGSEKKMRKFIKRYIRKNCGECNIEQDAFGNVLVTKGVADTYPCLASHIDQVQHAHSKDFCCISDGNVVFGYSPKSHEQQGLGADDKNGIYICLECLKKYDAIKCAFFVGEETGCIGSRDVDLEFFKDCRFIIEPDRRGSSDLITSMFCGCVCSDEFTKAIAPELYGYKEEHGSITDVGELVERGVGISCLNMSCGYYEAHTDCEFTVLPELENCLEFVESIIENVTSVYPHEYEWEMPSYKRGYVRLGGNNKTSYSSKSFFDDIYEDKCDDDIQYHDGGFYNADYDTMMSLLEVDENLSFEEVYTNYRNDFWVNDEDSLREIYNDAVYEIEERSLWNSAYDHAV